MIFETLEQRVIDNSKWYEQIIIRIWYEQLFNIDSSSRTKWSFGCILCLNRVNKINAEEITESGGYCIRQTSRDSGTGRAAATVEQQQACLWRKIKLYLSSVRCKMNCKLNPVFQSYHSLRFFLRYILTLKPHGTYLKTCLWFWYKQYWLQFYG